MVIINAIIFKIHWLACVIGGTLTGLAGLVGLIAFAFYADTWRKDLPLVLIAGVIGAVLDTLWIYLGILDFGTTLAPAWIVLLWMGLAMTFNHAMSIFQRYPLAGGLMAGIAAPMTYLTGQALGAVTVPNSLHLAIIAVSWAVLFWGLFRTLGNAEQASVSEASAA